MGQDVYYHIFESSVTKTTRGNFASSLLEILSPFSRHISSSPPTFRGI